MHDLNIASFKYHMTKKTFSQMRKVVNNYEEWLLEHPIPEQFNSKKQTLKGKFLQEDRPPI